MLQARPPRPFERLALSSAQCGALRAPLRSMESSAVFTVMRSASRGTWTRSPERFFDRSDRCAHPLTLRPTARPDNNPPDARRIIVIIRAFMTIITLRPALAHADSDGLAALEPAALISWTTPILHWACSDAPAVAPPASASRCAPVPLLSSSPAFPPARPQFNLTNRLLGFLWFFLSCLFFSTFLFDESQNATRCTFGKIQEFVQNSRDCA